MSDQTTWFYALDGASVGPVLAEEIRAKFAAGVIGPGTLCWQPGFGGEWRPVTEAGLGLRAPVLPPPPAPPVLPVPAATYVPASPPPRPAGPPPRPGEMGGAAPFPGPPLAVGAVSEAAAWTVALLPLASVVLGYLLDLASVNAGNAFNVAFFVATLFVIRQDIKQMRAAGVANPPSAWWVLLPPVYLWKRANRLGRSKAPFWVLIAVYVLVAGVIGTVAFLTVAGLAEAPGCGAVQADVVRLWNTMDSVKRAGIVGSSLDGVKEISNGSNLDGQPTRSCSAVVVTGDGKRYNVDYDITNRGGTVYVNVTAR